MLETRGGVFVISLDFELAWGVRAKSLTGRQKEMLLGERAAIDEILKLFAQYGIHATWAIVGFLFFENREELLKALPQERPQYLQQHLAPCNGLDVIGESEADDPFHYAGSLVRSIQAFPYQEVATHTLSHSFFHQNKIGADVFRSDLLRALKIAADRGHDIKTLIFPRQQISEEYLKVCRESGLRAYRGKMTGWAYSDKVMRWEIVWRILRRADAYINLTGKNCSALECAGIPGLVNVPANRLLYPYSRCLGFLEPFKIRRVISEMSHAAAHGASYHLWWHPQNFGFFQKENMRSLAVILDHYLTMKKRYGMRSMNMIEIAGQVAGRGGGQGRR